MCFADEPTSALDWTNGDRVVELLRRAAHEYGRTVLLVSHDERVIPYADRIFSMDDGKLQERPMSDQPANADWPVAMT